MPEISRGLFQVPLSLAQAAGTESPAQGRAFM